MASYSSLLSLPSLFFFFFFFSPAPSSLSVCCFICLPRSDRLEAISPDKDRMRRWGGGKEAMVAGLRQGLVKRVVSSCWWSYLNSPPDSKVLLYLSHIQATPPWRTEYPQNRLSCRLAASQCIPFIRNGYDLLTCCGLSNFVSSLSESSIHAETAGETESRKQVSWGMSIGRRAGDLVTPAHSHMRLWGEIAPPRRLTHLPLSLFPSPPRQEMVQVCESPRPRSLQYPLCVLHCDLGLIDSPLGTCGEKQQMTCVQCWIDFTFYHQNVIRGSFRWMRNQCLGFSWDISSAFWFFLCFFWLLFRNKSDIWIVC